MANDYIIFNTLIGICETSFIHRAIVFGTSPTVRLDTNRNVNLGDFKSTADITNRVIIVASTRNNSIFGRDNCSTGFLTTIIYVIIRIVEGDVADCITIL